MQHLAVYGCLLLGFKSDCTDTAAICTLRCCLNTPQHTADSTQLVHEAAVLAAASHPPALADSDLCVQADTVMTVAALLFPPYNQTTYAQVVAALNEGASSGSVALGQLAAISKVGVLNNGICEVGEILDSGAGEPGPCKLHIVQDTHAWAGSWESALAARCMNQARACCREHKVRCSC